MNRLQKKCLVATAGLHLFLVLVLVFGAAFFTSRSKPDDTPLINVIPANLVDAAVNSGTQASQPPPPAPVVVQPPTPPPPTPTPPQPKPEPPQPVVKPEPVQPPEPVKPETLSPDALMPVQKPVKPAPKHEISLKPVIRKVTPVTDNHAAEEAKAEREAQKEAQRAQEARLNAIRTAARSIKDNSSTATDVEMPGPGAEAYANYGSVVKSIYTQAWTPPEDTASDDANTRVSVTIARDGSVISARILNRSGDSRVDATVQRTLDRVRFIAPFPDGAKERERTFIINFNLKAKRMLG